MRLDQVERTEAVALSRDDVRERKRTVQLGASAYASEQQRAQARESAIVLLERSILLGHRRLALQRLAEAIRIGASLTGRHWEYCNTIARHLNPGELDRIIASAVGPSIG